MESIGKTPDKNWIKNFCQKKAKVKKQKVSSMSSEEL